MVNSKLKGIVTVTQFGWAAQGWGHSSPQAGDLIGGDSLGPATSSERALAEAFAQEGSKRSEGLGKAQGRKELGIST